MNPGGTTPLVCVFGDVCIDRHLHSIPKDAPCSILDPDKGAYDEEAGGAALLRGLLDTLVRLKTSNQLEVQETPFTVRGVSDKIPKEQHRFARSDCRWEYIASEAKGPANPGRAWRMRAEPIVRRIKPEGGTAWPPVEVADSQSWKDASVLVLVDDDLGLREAKRGPQGLAISAAKPWVILKLRNSRKGGAPSSNGENGTSTQSDPGPYMEFLEASKERLIIVVPINDIRRYEVCLGGSLSWERMAEDVMYGLQRREGDFNFLRMGAHLVITIPHCGALLLSGRSNKETEIKSKETEIKSKETEIKSKLFYDPTNIEGTWERDYPGRVLGDSTCFAAGICYSMIGQEGASAEDVARRIGDGILRGLAAMRQLHVRGYQMKDRQELKFPREEVAKALAAAPDKESFREVEVPMELTTEPPAMERQGWAILGDCCKDTSIIKKALPNIKKKTPTLWDLAHAVAKQGIETILPGVPRAIFNKLVVVDRWEIEGYRSISNLIDEYCRREKVDRPLCIAVFGPPGTGKSYGIEQVAVATRPGEIEFLKFNLSQLGAPTILPVIYRKTRDAALQNKIPVVFWDEFDTTLNGDDYGWLRHFLGPMNDGQYEDEQGLHPLGKCIFVFAGSRDADVEGFKKAGEKHQKAKISDFVSRLSGFLTLAGVNPIDADDLSYVIRRAVLVRSMLRKYYPRLFQANDQKEKLCIQDGVLRALLTIPEYKHNFRSVQSVISMCRLAGRDLFEQSAVPSKDQLNLHVNGEEFLELVALDDTETRPLDEDCPVYRKRLCPVYDGRSKRQAGAPECFLRRPACRKA